MPQGPAYRTEEELLDGLRQDAPGALEVFVERHADVIFGVAVKVVGDGGAAKSLICDACSKALDSLDSLKSAKALERLVLREACSILQDQAAGTPPADLKLQDLLPPMNGGRSANVVDWSLDPREEARRSEEKDAVRDLVAGMPRPYALVLVLHDMEEFSPQSVGDILQLPIQAVKNRLQIARFLLREGLTQRLTGPSGGGVGRSA